MFNLRSFSPPTQDARLQLSIANVNIENVSFGEGVIFVCESHVAILNGQSEGFTLTFPQISAHGISKAPQECLFMIVDGEQEFFQHSADDDDSGDEDVDEVVQLQITPTDLSKLQDLYNEISYCQTLHPDEEDEFSDEEFCGPEEQNNAYQQLQDGPSDGFYTTEAGFDHLTPEGIANLNRFNQMLICDPSQHTEDSPAPEHHSNQFDDAEPEH